MSRKLRIGVLGTGLIDWGGGVDLLRVILSALAAPSRGSNLEIVLFLPNIKSPSTIKGLVKLGVSYLTGGYSLREMREHYWNFESARMKVAGDETDRADILEALGRSSKSYYVCTYTGKNELIKLIGKRNIDVIFPSMHTLGLDFPVPWVGYIPDFQHKHLPHYFSSEERIQRDDLFAEIVNSAAAMIVTSTAVKNDIQQYCPTSKCKVFVMPFSPLPSAKWFEDDLNLVELKYKLPNRFFLISSQLWRHKSHVTAIDALALLHKHREYADLKLVFTGKTDDYRHPDYFDEIMNRIQSHGLNDSVLILGYIPKIDQVNIMKKSIAIVQPTLFEGSQGGLAVYDAVGIGVRAIVSDIPVNKEIQDPLVTFFNTTSAADLASKMINVVEQPKPIINKHKQLELSRLRLAELRSLLLDCIASVTSAPGHDIH